MISEVAKRMMAKVPLETKIFVKKYADLVVLINQVLREKGYSQKSLAQKLEKQPSEIHKWLNGDHNFTLKSICKMEAELGIELLHVPVKKTGTVYKTIQGNQKFKVYTNISKTSTHPGVKHWEKGLIHNNQYSNVG